MTTTMNHDGIDSCRSVKLPKIAVYNEAMTPEQIAQLSEADAKLIK